MKKIQRILYIFIFVLLVIGLNKTVEANSIKKISMDIYVDNKGDATVTEIWDCRVNKGTEVYHPYYNLGKSQIKDLKVKENGIDYQMLPLWRTSGTLSDKANKCGINQISNGVELCWGISSYGKHTYTVQYTITNFIADLTDSQMIYWTLIPHDFSNSIGNVYIKIHTDFNIPNTTGVWGYGNYGGTADAYNGYIEMQSDGRLDTNEYMTILVKFPSSTFNTENTINQNFNYYYEMAEKGAVHYKKSGSNNLFFLAVLIGLYIIGTIFFIIVIKIYKLIASLIANLIINKIKISTLNFGEAGKKIPRDVNYFRDIPCNGDIFRAYYIGYQYGLLKNKTDILGAIILKWLKDGIIRIEPKEAGKMFKREDTVIILNEKNSAEIENAQEKRMFRMLYEASIDGILENKEFISWCKQSYSKVLEWFDTILDEQRDKLTDEGLITIEEKTTLKFFKTTEHTATMELKYEANRLAGLQFYLKDYTYIEDREAIEVTLFEEYLVFAQLMGIAKKVAKEFKGLYPEIIEQSNYNSYDNIIFINYCLHNGIQSGNTAKAMEVSTIEISSGDGGGFSSGGGGGGSFGGGGGGGGFR